MDGSQEYKTALKDVIKWEIQALLDRLSETGEESVVLTVSVDRASCGHLGSKKGKGFAEFTRLDDVQQQFLGYCASGAPSGLIMSDCLHDMAGQSQALSGCFPEDLSQASSREAAQPVKKPGRARKRKQPFTVRTYTKDNCATMYLEPESQRAKVSRVESSGSTDEHESISPGPLSVDGLETCGRDVISDFENPTPDMLQQPTDTDSAALSASETDSLPPAITTENIELSDTAVVGQECAMPTENQTTDLVYGQNASSNIHVASTPLKEQAEGTLNTSTELNNISPTFRNALCLMPTQSQADVEAVARGADLAKFEVLEPSMVQVKIEDEDADEYISYHDSPVLSSITNDTLINFQRPICSLTAARSFLGNQNPFYAHLSARALDLDLKSAGLSSHNPEFRLGGLDRTKSRKRKPRADVRFKIKNSFTNLLSPQSEKSPTQKKEPLFSYKDAGTICSECGQEFNKPESMIRHKIRKHLPRTFVCEVCQKGFSFKSELDKHFRIHSGEKPYACAYCPRLFADGGNRMKHEIRCKKKVVNQTF